MNELTVEQLRIVEKLNNLKLDPKCQRGCVSSCWLATEAAANALRGIFAMPRGYEGCDNGTVVAMTLGTLEEMSKGTSE